MKLKIKKNDTVQVITGNDKGVQGRVLDIDTKKMRILVEGVNLRKKHTRPSQEDQKGGIKEKEIAIHYSNVMVVDSDKVPTRTGVRIEEKGGKKSKIRYSKNNDKQL